MKRLVIGLAAALALLATLLAVRQGLAPEPGSMPPVHIGPEDADRLRALVEDSRIEPQTLQEDLRRVEILLVGEVHFYRETLTYLTRLLDGLSERKISLLLELAEGIQPRIDRYLETGDEAELDEIWATSSHLPYRPLLAWAREHRGKVPVVRAMDENRGRVVLNRTFLRDTRNQTMADAILRARREHPEHLVVAYGGQMHMMLAGRYRYDVDNRSPVGARLLRDELPREKIRSLMLSGSGEAPITTVWTEPGIVTLRGGLGHEPYEIFVPYPVFGAPTATELFDVFVHLGALTPTR